MVAVAVVTGAQIAHQQMAATEDIQREVAVVIVIAVKELAGLLAVHGNIVVIKVQHDLLGWLVMLLNEVMPQ